MVQQDNKPTTINIAIPIELIMDTDIDAILELNLSENSKVLETDDSLELIVLSGCSLDAMLKLFDIAPYFTLEKTFERFSHTGVDLEIDFIVGINVELDL